MCALPRNPGMLRQSDVNGFAVIELEDRRQLGRRKVLAVSGLAAIAVCGQRTASRSRSFCALDAVGGTPSGGERPAKQYDVAARGHFLGEWCWRLSVCYKAVGETEVLQ